MKIASKLITKVKFMELYAHQQEALHETAHRNRVAYYHDMGLGKTFTGAEKIMRLSAPINLIICQKSKIDDWFNHMVQNYSGQNIIVNNLTNKLELEYFLEMSTKDHEPTMIGIINYELAWRRKDLLKLHDFTLMLDESSLIQNKKTQMTKFILKMNPKNVVLLSGTPTSGKYENLWTQMKLLGWDISDSLYQKQYVNWITMSVGGITFRTVDKKDPYKNVERLKRKMRENGCHFLKTEEVMTLPDQTFVEIKCPKSKAYSKFMKNSIVTVDDVELVGDTSLTKQLYARQLCGHYNDEKLKAFRDILESTNDRLIVFYNFNDELHKLKEIAHEYTENISEVNGSIKDLTAYETYDDSITFVQYQAGAMGLNLQKANKIVYFTLPQRSELFEQSKKRIHRIGQKRPCFYYVMMCRKSVEEDIYETLKMLRDYTDELFKERRE